MSQLKPRRGSQVIFSDGMSDVRSRYAADVRIDGRDLRGCARFRPVR